AATDRQTTNCKPRNKAPSASVAPTQRVSPCRRPPLSSAMPRTKAALDASSTTVLSAGSATGSRGTPTGGHTTACTRTYPYAKKSAENIIAHDARKMLIPSDAVNSSFACGRSSTIDDISLLPGRRFGLFLIARARSALIPHLVQDFGLRQPVTPECFLGFWIGIVVRAVEHRRNHCEVVVNRWRRQLPLERADLPGVHLGLLAGEDAGEEVVDERQLEHAQQERRDAGERVEAVQVL